MKMLLSIFLALSALCGYAQSTLKIHQKDGTLLCYPFTEQPKVTFVDGILVVVSKGLTAEFPLADVEKFTFEENTTSILDKELKVSNTQSGYWEIYSLEGKLVCKEKTTNGNVMLLLGNLQKGIYIIKGGKTSCKFILD